MRERYDFSEMTKNKIMFKHNDIPFSNCFKHFTLKVQTKL